MTKVKICGVTSPADAELAASLGAWAVGLVLHADSPRRCDPVAAAEITAALRRRAEVVGVFVNATLDEVTAAVEGLSLTMIQLHGDEGPSYCEEVRRRSGVKVIKAVSVRSAADVRALSSYGTDYQMLDAHVPGRRGGTGQSFDWSLAAGHPGRPALILSGGLRPENVGRAVQTVGPFAVDVSSGVEAAPGRKDHDSLRRFFDAVHDAAAARL